MRPLLAGVLILGALAGASGAHAAKKEGAILILKLESEGLAPELVTVLDEAVRTGVRRAKKGRVLPAPALDFSGMQMAAGCLDDSADCLLSMGRPLNATRVIRVVMSGNNEHATFTITVVGMKKGRAQTYEAKLDDLGPESKEELTWHTLAALGIKQPPLEGGIELFMASSIGSLEGAEYFLDDKKVPRSALESLAPGAHRVEVHQKGFETFIWIGEIKKGRTEQVRVEFKPRQSTAVAVGPPDEPPPGSWRRHDDLPPPAGESPPPSLRVATTHEAPIIYTFVVGGAAVVAAGVAVAFLVIGKNAHDALVPHKDDPNYSQCTEDRSLPECEPFQPHLDRLHSATIGNFAGFITAGVLAAGAVGVFFLEKNAEVEGHDVAFGVAPTDGGAAASMSMRF